MLKKYKGLILTVGAQGEQIKFSIKTLNPEYIGILGTNTENCRKTIDDIFSEIKYPLTHLKIEYVEDNPQEIKSIIQKFDEIYKWLLKTHNLKEDEIAVDPTGGRKWMSAGVYMIASFLGLELVYVDVLFVNGKPDTSSMRIVNMGNAYQQTGFLEEIKGDELFNKYNFESAIKIYKFLSEKVSDNRKFIIKKFISEGLKSWSQFKFKEAYDNLKKSLDKINQFGILTQYSEKIKRYIEILEILKKNDEQNISYMVLIKDKDFSEKILLTLLSQSERYIETGNYDLATILLYRILELIGQIKLAQYDIDTNKITDEIRKKYNTSFEKITQKIFGAKSEIPDRIGLMHSWILLYCLKDEIFKDLEVKFLRDLRNRIEIRDLLWIEHRNKNVKEEDCIKFKKYCENWIRKLIPNFQDKLCDFHFIKF